ncbi:carboxypeptidase regulatory-like domain-containing protein [bacterium]|nr:carboxypeptidase regulatory-like domain-containing protein [bacterium]
MTYSSIAGVIRNEAGAASPGVEVSLYQAGVLKRTGVTEADGVYTFSELLPGTYVVVPRAAGFGFDPAHRVVTVPPECTTANFTALARTHYISGVVKNTEGAPLLGVTMNLYQCGVFKRSTATNGAGAYAFLELTAGTYSVQPAGAGLAFDPATRSITVPPDCDTADFTVNTHPSTVSGVIRLGDAALPDVTVNLYQGGALKQTALTDGTGRYTFSELAPGTYVVVPTGTGLSFDPACRSVTVPPSTTTADFTAAPQTYTISGLIVKPNLTPPPDLTPLPGIGVSLYQAGVLKQTALTDGTGRYTFSGLTAGAYLVLPTTSGYTFDPASRAVTVGPSTTKAHFAATPLPSTISGVIKSVGGTTRPGLTVNLYQAGVLKQTALTDAEGRYTFSEVVAGTYVVKPAYVGLIFDPAHRVITVPPSTSTANFTAVAIAYSISGTIKTASGTALAGVTVALYQGDIQKATTTTNAEGRYCFADLVASTYSVRPLGELLTFDPANRTIALPPSTSTANFVAGYLICGTVKTAEGVGIAGVSVGLYKDGSLVASRTTSSNGRYYFLNLDAGAYSVAPLMAGVIFDPAVRAVVLPPSATGVDFVGIGSVYTISGQVTTHAGAAVAEVTVRLYRAGTLVGATATNNEGRYTFAHLEAGTYVVIPSRTHMTFNPTRLVVTLPPGTTTADFTGATTE